MELAQSTAFPVPRLLLAAIGAAIAWASFKQYRARRQDPDLPRDPATDRWWRRLLLAAGIVVADTVLVTALHDTIGIAHNLVDLSMVVLAVGILGVFVAAFMIGWRHLP